MGSRARARGMPRSAIAWAALIDACTSPRDENVAPEMASTSLPISKGSECALPSSERSSRCTRFIRSGVSLYSRMARLRSRPSGVRPTAMVIGPL